MNPQVGVLLADGSLSGMLPRMRSATPSPAPPIRLRPVRDEDLDAVLALNEAEVEMLAPMDQARADELRGLADRFDVVEVAGVFGGFVVTFAPAAPYDSENFRWFGDRHAHQGFYYLDRFVLHPSRRRLGIGGRVYDEIESAASSYGRMALEVNLVPRNDASLAFHAGRGYVEVGQLGDPQHLVSLMEKAL
jgi:predicted GNAT superfamily acetyltransferase